MAKDLDLSGFDEEIEKDDNSIDLSAFDEEVSISPGEGSMPDDFSPEEAEKMSALQAGLAGVSEGATFGADRTIGGVVGALAEDFDESSGGVLSDIAGSPRDIKNQLEYLKKKKELGITEEKPDILDSYRESKKLISDQAETAMEDQPASFIAGNIAGGLPTASALTGAKGIASLDKIKRLKDTGDRAKLLGKLQTAKKLSGGAFKEGLKLTTKEGAKAGALTGLNLGESEDFADTLGDVAKGATLGAGFSAGLKLGGKGLSSILAKIPGISDAVDSFKLGIQGKSIEADEVKDAITKTSRRYLRDFNARLEKLGLKKGEMDEIIDSLGITINTKEDLIDARKVINSIDSKSIRKKAAGLMDVIEDYMGESKEYKKATESLQKSMAKNTVTDEIAQARAKLDKKAMKRAIEGGELPVESTETNIFGKDLKGELPNRESLVREDIIDSKDFGPITRRTSEDITPFKPESLPDESALGFKVQKYKDLSSGKVQSAATSLDDLSKLNPEELSVPQAQDLLDELNSQFTAIGNSSESLPKKVERQATKLAKQLRTKINAVYGEAGKKTGNDITSINKKFTNYLEAKKLGGVDGRSVTALDKDMELKHMAQFIQGQSDQDVVSNLDLFLKRIRKADPEMFKKYGKEIASLRRKADLASGQGALESGSQVGALVGALSGFANRVSNLVGRMTSAPLRGAQSVKGRLGRASSKFINSAPDSVQELLQRSQNITGGNNFTAQLQKAAEAPETKRRAILFGLYSNPAFRKMFGVNSEDEN